MFTCQSYCCCFYPFCPFRCSPLASRSFLSVFLFIYGVHAKKYRNIGARHGNYLQIGREEGAEEDGLVRTILYFIFNSAMMYLANSSYPMYPTNNPDLPRCTLLIILIFFVHYGRSGAMLTLSAVWQLPCAPL